MSHIHLYVTGLWPSSDANGLVALSQKFSGPSLFAKYDEDLVSLVSPYDTIRMAGHSFGGEACVKAARKLSDAGRVVESLLLLDPVVQGWVWPWNWGTPSKNFILPPNIRKALCIKNSWGLPPSSEILNLSPQHSWANKIVNFNHANYPRSPEVIELVSQFF